MTLINADVFLEYLIFSKYIDSLKCKEVREAIELCAVKDIYTKADIVALLTELELEIANEPLNRRVFYFDGPDETTVEMGSISKIIQQKIDKYKAETGPQENKGAVALIKPSQTTTTLRQLMQTTSEDCVSRQMVKEGMIKYGFRAPDMTVTEFIEDELLSATSTQKWIPVSERLPNLDDYTDSEVWQEKVLITGYLSFDDTKSLFVSEAFAKDIICNCVHDIIVTAWQPLPKPYEEK